MELLKRFNTLPRRTKAVVIIIAAGIAFVILEALK